jgi:hypothetical protein
VFNREIGIRKLQVVKDACPPDTFYRLADIQTHAYIDDTFTVIIRLGRFVVAVAT